MVIEAIHREDALPATARGYARDTITLGWEDRLHGRPRRRDRIRSAPSAGHDPARPRLPAPRRGEGRRRCRRATGAGVFLIEPRTPQQWGPYSYHVGNRHPFARATLAFTPAGSASGHDQ